MPAKPQPKKKVRKLKPKMLGSGMAKSAASKLKAAQSRRKKRLDSI